jgi:hypothetical protein
MSVKTPSEQIDDIIAMHPDWHAQRLAQLRHLILDAAPGIGEDVKWKKPSRPEVSPCGHTAATSASARS